MPPWVFHPLGNQESRSKHCGGSIRFQLWVQATGNLSWRKGVRGGGGGQREQQEGGFGVGHPVSTVVGAPAQSELEHMLTFLKKIQIHDF